MIENVWIFHGAESNFAHGVFTDKDFAESWIKQYKLTGTFSLYPLNKGIYDWAIHEALQLKSTFIILKDCLKVKMLHGGRQHGS